MIKLFLFITLAIARGAEKTQLALNWKPEPQFGGFYAARDAFKRRGIEVDIRPGGSGTPVVQMVAAGQSEFGIASADEVAMSRANGGDVVALFAVYQINPQCLMARAERKVASVRELFASEGPLAMQKGLPYAQFLLRKYSARKATIVPYLGGLANFLADPRYAQQGFAASEPLAAERSGVKPIVFLVADEGFNPYTTVLIARGSTIDAKPSLAKAMAESAREGWAAYLKEPGPANSEMRKLNPSMDAATFEASARAQARFIENPNGLGRMTDARWNALVKQLSESGSLRGKRPLARELYRDF